MIKKVLFIPYPAYSHFVSLFPYAHEYKSKGFEVYMAGIPAYSKLVTGQGFLFLPFTYLENYPIRNFKTAWSLFYNSYRSNYFLRRRFRSYLNSVNKISQLVNMLEPDQIVLDAHLSFYCIYFHHRMNNTIIFNTKLSTRPDLHTPPLNHALNAKNQSLIKSMSVIMWCFNRIKLGATHKVEKLVFRMNDEHSFIQWSLKKIKKQYRELFLPRSLSLFHYELDPVKAPVEQFVLKTNQIEYPWKKLYHTERYLSLTPFIHIQAVSEHQNLYTFLNSFLALKREVSKVRLIYCSLGSMTSGYRQKCYKFLNETIKAFNGKNNYKVIVSSSGIAPSEFSFDDNVFIRENIPQHNVLQYADLMITHGGLNSVLECLHFNVPMLIYPVNPHFDQKGNGARVRFAGLGLNGKMSSADADSILTNALKAMELKNNLLSGSNHSPVLVSSPTPTT